MKRLIIIAFFFYSIVSFGQSKTEKLDSLFNTLFKQGQFNGNVLIVDSGEIIYEKSFGFADFNNKTPLNSNSIFELGSLSKQFTAMAVMILKERGLLTYEDDIKKYIPEIPYHNVTIRNLLTHTSGIPDHFNYPERWGKDWNSVPIQTNEALLSEIIKRKPNELFASGEKFDYSNTNYDLLAMIVVRVSKMPFRFFLKHTIFDPLQMMNSFCFTRFDKSVLKNVAIGYEYSMQTGRYVNSEQADEVKSILIKDGTEGDGNIKSTSTDLEKWDIALYTNKLVNQQTISEAFTPFKFSNDSTTDYGFGWFIVNNQLFGKQVNHAGGAPGFSTYIARYIDKKQTIIILKNKDTYGFRGTAKAVENILNNLPFDIPKQSIAEVLRTECSKSDLQTIKTKYDLIKDNEHYSYNEFEFLKVAQGFVINRKYDEAKFIFNIILTKNPKSAYAWNFMGDVYLENKLDNEALTCYEQAITLNPDYERAVSNLRTLKARLKK